MILALSGGVGGAKLVHGLSQILAPEDLTTVVNTGDDFEHFGLYVAPDLDTVMYTLAGVANAETGWGRDQETWHFMGAVEALGGPTWFRLGDRDLATHAERTRLLGLGHSLSDVTRMLSERLGVSFPLAPMSDDAVRTLVRTREGMLAFQHYFVRERCEPPLEGLEYRGASTATPSPAVRAVLASTRLDGVVICPSNPHLSIGPMLALPEMRAALRAARPVIAVSPLIAGAALRGPAAKIMAELGLDASVVGVAEYYCDIIDALVIDTADAKHAAQIESMNIRAVVADTVMRSIDDRARLARTCLSVVTELA